MERLFDALKETLSQSEEAEATPLATLGACRTFAQQLSALLDDAADAAADDAAAADAPQAAGEAGGLLVEQLTPCTRYVKGWPQHAPPPRLGEIQIAAAFAAAGWLHAEHF